MMNIKLVNTYITFTTVAAVFFLVHISHTFIFQSSSFAVTWPTLDSWQEIRSFSLSRVRVEDD